MPALRGFGLFVAGIAFGMILMQSSSAQESFNTGLKLNHVGISVKDLDESVNYYTKTMGFHEAFTVRNPAGKVAFTYIQISRDTFLELFPSTPERPVGITHFGLQADDAKATVTRLHGSGVTLPDAAPNGTKAIMTALNDPNGIRIEISEFPPDSLHGKAIAGWK